MGGSKKSGRSARSALPVAPAVLKRSRSQRPHASGAAVNGDDGRAGTSLDAAGGKGGSAGTNLYNVEWTAKEQQLLEKGLREYPAERNASLLRYVKVAANLPSKGVRDVALRVRWMARKDSGKKGKGEEVKGKRSGEARSQSVFNVTTPAPGLYSRPVTGRQQPATSSRAQRNGGGGRNQHGSQAVQNGGGRGQQVPAAMVGMGVDNQTGDLLQQNINIINQIRHNLDTCQVNENTDLFLRLRDNISSILNGMTNSPGIMSHMPAIPVKLNVDLANRVLA